MPLVSLWDGSVVAVEVRARWHQADGWVLLPAQFLPRVDDGGLWMDLDQAVKESALQAASSLPASAGLGVNPREIVGCGGSSWEIRRARSRSR